MTEIPFRFDEATHTYTELATGRRIPNISELLDRSGLVDANSKRFWTPEGRARGSAVHHLTAMYDRGTMSRVQAEAIPKEHPHKGYILGHIAMIDTVRPAFDAIEQAAVHPRFRFGGRSDRVGMVYDLCGVLEEKTGDPEKSHAVQTALQAILEAGRYQLDPEHMARFCVYLKANGGFRVEEFTRRRDFDRAYKAIRECCA